MNDQEYLTFILRMKDEAAAVLKKHEEAVKPVGDSYDEAGKKASLFQRILSQASGGATTLSGAVKNLTVNMVALGAPVAAGVLAANSLEGAYSKVVGVFREMIKNTVDYEKSQKALGGALKITGGAVGMSKGAINDIVADVSERTLTDDTDVRNAASKLILMGRTTRESFQGAMDVSVQLSRVMGSDLVTASRMVSRAMADPEHGMNALRRAGILLTESEKERIKLMEMSGGRSAAQAEALRVLTERIGSPDTSAVGKGLSGALKGAAFAWDEFQDQFNDSILSRATAEIINLTSAGVKFFTVFKERSQKEQVDVRKTAIDSIESQINLLKGKTVLTGGEKNMLKDLEFQLGEVRKQLRLMGEDEATAFRKGLLADANEAAASVDKLLAGMGLLRDANTGIITDKAQVEADAKVAGAKRAVAIAERDLNAVLDGGDTAKPEDRERHLVRLQQAQAALRAAKAEAEVAGNIRKTNKEMEDRVRIAESPQAQRAILQAGLKAYDDNFKYGEAQAKAAQAQAEAAERRIQAARFNDQNAATSREVKYQIDLANAYLRSTHAARQLMAEQKAMEAGVTGSGYPDVRDARNLEFFKSLVDLNAETRKTLEELPDIEAKIKASMNSAGAFGYGAIESVLAKIRDLRTKAFGDASPEGLAQQAKLAQAEGEARAAAQKRASGQIGQAQADFIARARDEIELARTKIDMADRSQLLEDRAIANLEAERERRKLLALGLADEAQLKKRLAQIEERRAMAGQLAEANEAARRAAGPLNTYLRDVQDGWRAYEAAGVSALNQTDDTLTSILTRTRDWQSAMHDLLNSVAADFLKIGIRQNVTAPLAGAVFGTATNSGLIGGAFDWIRNQFAGGGIMTSRGPVPLRRYAGGGIANSPQLAMFGEGSTPEAYVPVPNGRIPVTLKGGGGSYIISPHIEVHVNGSGADGGVGGGVGDPAEIGKMIGAMVNAEFNRNLRDNMRPGGILNPAGNFSPGYAS